MGNFVSKQALAAIGSTTVIVSMIVFFFSGFAIGAGVVIGNSFGAKNMERLHDAIHTAIAAAFVFSLLLTLLGVATVALLHIWKGNTFMSIGLGTVFYMFLVQVVF